MRIQKYLKQVSYDKLIDMEDPEYECIEMKYALVQESSDEKKVFVFEFDSRNLEELQTIIRAASDFYVDTIYESVPLRHYLRIISVNSDVKQSDDDTKDPGIEEMVLYPRR